MPVNTLEFATLLQTKLDQKAVIDMTSGWMDANAGEVIYNGGKKIKIPTITTSGLKDYDREHGYPEGSVNLAYEELDMTQDRSTSFTLDAMDVNETNFLASATNVTNTFQKDNVVPEVDAYRYSRLASYAPTENVSTYTPSSDDIFKKLKYDIAAVQDIVGENEPLICSMNGLVKAQLEELEQFRKMIDVVDFAKGSITTKVKAIDNCIISTVPSARMYDTYTFKDGSTEGETEGGFTKGTTARLMNWIIVPQNIAIAVVKQDKMKIIDPDTYQKADAWFIGYRKYHDLWVKSQKKKQIRVSKQA